MQTKEKRGVVMVVVDTTCDRRLVVNNNLFVNFIFYEKNKIHKESELLLLSNPLVQVQM